MYPDEAACLAECRSLPDADVPWVFDPTQTGRSFACRGHRLTVATIDPDLHCPVAAGIGFCNDGY
jgi:hypothetical protein